MNETAKRAIWATAIIIASLTAFLTGKKIYYTRGFNAGAVFADTSGYKQGYRLGFELCYQLRDSIAKTETSNEENLNLNIIYEELGNPEKFISITGEVAERNLGGKTSASWVKYARGKIESSASFARYKDISITAKFFDKRNASIGKATVTIPEILYPGRVLIFVISEKEVPEFTETVQFELENAHGMD